MPGFEARADEQRSRMFVHGALIACLILQRFGFMVGDSVLFACLPLFGALLAWAFASGLARLRRRTVAFYLLFAAWSLAVSIVALLTPDARFGFSLASLAAVLITYALTVVGPSTRFDRRVVLEIFILYALICAIGGIAQFLLQFIGVSIFSFMRAVPALTPVLVESQFNHNPLVTYGSIILRANGFFLLEPSMFSQVIAIAMVIDYFILERVRFLPVYVVAYLLSFSGTGALSLALALPFYAAQSRRNLGQVVVLAAIAVVGLGLAMVLIPDQMEILLGRSTEFSQSGSSGFARFVEPFTLVGQLTSDPRFLWGWGPGATERYIYHLPGTGNSIAKLIIDYGAIGLMLFMLLLVGALRTVPRSILTAIAVTTFLVGGGYLLFTPMLVMLFLICIWSDPSLHSTDNGGT